MKSPPVKFLSLFCLSIFSGQFLSSLGMPAEEPTKFSLATGDLKSKDDYAVSGLMPGRELLGRAADAIRIGTGRLVNSVTLARNIIADRAENLASETQNNGVSTFAKAEAFGQVQGYPTTTQYPPVTNTRANARENVRLENETAQSFLEKPVPKPFMGILESFLKPTPIVDGIKEKDKYGNSGDKFIGIGRALVNGFEGFSNFLNSIVDLPRNAAKKTSRGITEALNQVGARLVGLQ